MAPDPRTYRVTVGSQVLDLPIVDVAPDVEVRVWDSNAEIRYMVLPMRPAGTDGWSEEKLAGLVTRDAMIGTDIPKVKA